MSIFTKALAALGGLTLAGGIVGVATPAHASGTVHGCPSGAVCIYPQNAGWNGDRPSIEFWSYGAHNLSSQVGHHYVVNNQITTGTGPAYVDLMSGYDGHGSAITTVENYDWRSYLDMPGYNHSQHGWLDVDLTPINSVVLKK